MFNPYSYTIEDSGYVFQTDLGLEYIVYFSDYSYLFPSESSIYSNIYAFDIAEITGNADDSLHDSRIGDTVTEILTLFFQDIDNVIIFVCDSLDGRQQARMRKFSIWFSKANISNIEKYDYSANTDDCEILNSLLINSKNPEKKDNFNRNAEFG